MHCKCDAVIIKRTRYSETSLILVLFTREFGRIDAIAKGCRRPKSPLRGHLDLFEREDIVLWRGQRSSLDIVTEAELSEENFELRKRPTAVAAVSYLSEIILRTCLLHDEHYLAFDALTDLLRKLNDGAPVASSTAYAMLQVLIDIGIAPVLDRCALCGESAENEDLFYFSITANGLVCKACHASHKSGKSLRRNALQVFLAYGKLAQLPETDKSTENVFTKIVEIIGQYIEYSIGRELKSRKLLVNALRKERGKA